MQRRIIREKYVRYILSKYTSYIAEKQVYENWMAMHNNQEQLEKLSAAASKVIFVQSLLTLLNDDEKFVIENHLIKGLEWPRVAFAFAEVWKGEFTRTERTLVAYQASGLAKLVNFCTIHQNLFFSIFEKQELEHLD